MNRRTFTCECCKKTFGKAWSDEKREAEYKKLWPEDQNVPVSIVCDSCFVEVREWFATLSPEEIQEMRENPQP